MEEELLIKHDTKENSFILRLKGDITKTSGSKLLNYYDWDNGLPEQGKILVIDFQNVNYINSAGIGFIIRLCRVLSQSDVVIKAFGLEYHYEKIFHIVGLSKYITQFPSEWAAIESE